MPASVASRFARRILALFLLLAAAPSFGGEAPSVDLFNPQGTARKVRQATARFTEAMVPFGDPRLSDPFEVSCTGGVKGRGAGPTAGAGRTTSARSCRPGSGAPSR